MPSEKEKSIPVSEFRANMTKVLYEVQILDKPIVLTSRNTPVAKIVPIDWGKDAA